MHSRQSLIEIFSTFIEFRADCFSCWVIDHRLHKSFQQCQDRFEEQSSEEFWVLYWHADWKKQPNGIALRHLSAYLQESCYWSAQKAMRVLGQTSYRLSDCFQLASADLEKVLTHYDPRRGASLKGYAKLVYGSSIRDTLRQSQEADICSPWTLLRRVGKRRLLAALRHAGLSSKAVAQYRLAWMCYGAHYGAAKCPNRKLREPSQAQWTEIASLYNAERLTQLEESSSALTPESLKQRLTQCSKWVRAYLYPTIRSLNVPSPNRDAGELQDELADVSQSSPMNVVIESEEVQCRQFQQAQINQVLTVAIANLTPDNQAIIRYYYHDDLTQVQIANQLDLKQYTVSRRLNKVRETLLSALTDWAQTMHIAPSPDLIESMSVALEEWLVVHYRDQT